MGPELELGTRLIPTSVFTSEAGRAALIALIKENLPIASPYIVAGTPFNFKAEQNATSVTPAWRDSVWHVRFPFPLFLLRGGGMLMHVNMVVVD